MLRDLQLRSFRCFESVATEFSPGFNFIVGPNGQYVTVRGISANGIITGLVTKNHADYGFTANCQ